MKITTSPFFGRDGKYVTSRHIHDRLIRELDRNLALRVEKGAREDQWTVFGRGVLHLSVLIETMRREGYELQVGQPKVIIKEIDGVKCDPIDIGYLSLLKSLKDARYRPQFIMSASFLHSLHTISVSLFIADPCSTVFRHP